MATISNGKNNIVTNDFYIKYMEILNKYLNIFFL